MKTFYLLIFFIILLGVACEQEEPEVPKSSAKEISSPSIPIPNATSSFDSGINTYTYIVPANTNIMAINFDFLLSIRAISNLVLGSVQYFSIPTKYGNSVEDGCEIMTTFVVKEILISNIS